MKIDKLLHLLVGLAIVGALHPLGVLPALAALCLAGIGKEIRDSMGYGTPDAYDALVTIGGGLLMLAWLETLQTYL